jgi:hypothetical protein
MERPVREGRTFVTNSWPIVCLALIAICAAMVPYASQRDLSTTGYRLHVDGRVVDADDKSLDLATVAIDTNGTPQTEMGADTKGRFAFDLDIGGFYGITVSREGFVRKRFIVDARTEDPSKVITGPFLAEVTLTPEAAFANMDIKDLYYPYALVSYSKKDKAFIADIAYIQERQRVEAALKLGAARARKRSAK